MLTHIIIGLQPPNNDVYYEAVGDSLAINYFDVDRTSGDISVKRSLLNDPSKQYKFIVLAKDQGKNQMVSDNATVVIEVVRNENTPIFERTIYTAGINQNQGVGNRVAQVRAVDKDPEVGLCVFF